MVKQRVFEIKMALFQILSMCRIWNRHRDHTPSSTCGPWLKSRSHFYSAGLPKIIAKDEIIIRGFQVSEPNSNLEII